VIDQRSPVSVVIPVFNGERFLGEALQSVAAQTLAPREVIVVDDGSTDGSAALAAAFDPTVTVVRQPNAGVAVARNRGVAGSTGGLIGFLDQDDRWPPTRTAALVAALEEHPQAGAAAGATSVFGDGALPGRPETDPQAGRTFRTLALGSALIRRRTFDSLGGLAEDLGTADDVDWFMKARDRGMELHRIPAVTLEYRWHGDNTSADVDRTLGSLVSAMKASLDRRRTGAGS
jgi:glycosyltransferase involved in cell wall biosynthesis